MRFEKLILIDGTANTPLAQAISRHMGVPLANSAVTAFPNLETDVDCGDVRDADVFIIQPTSIPANQTLMQLIFMIDAARRASAGRITAVIPYFGYQRQDKKDQPHKAIAAKVVAKMIEAAGADRVMLMHLHAAQIQGFFEIPADHLFTHGTLIQEIRKAGLVNPVVISPDAGAAKNSLAFSELLGAGWAIITKTRKSPTEVVATSLNGDVEGRDAILVDDLTETAGTLDAGYALLKARGARRIFGAVSHKPLTEIGRQKLAASGIEGLFATDSINTEPHPKIIDCSVAELIGNAINNVHQGISLGPLFNVPAA